MARPRPAGTSAEIAPLTLPDAAAWRAWLAAHPGATEAWVVLARKGVTAPTSLTYDAALEEALCHGWVDGMMRGGDGRTYLQRFTPRRRRSTWSRRNVALVERLTTEGRMQPAGLAAVARARDDGSWDGASAARRPPA